MRKKLVLLTAVAALAAAPGASAFHHTGLPSTVCAAEPIILAVAPASSAAAPHRDEIEAFVIAPGQAVVMHRNVWHDACRGVTRPAAYYWMAICGLGESPWVPLEGGPRRVEAPEGASA